MREGRPSATAQRVAERRAAHQLLDRPLVFEDPLALAILGRARAEALRANPRARKRDLWDRALRAFLAARSRLAEDTLARAVKDGVGQYVVLGAGLDTFAYRSRAWGESLRVFEVDHPATQAWKRERLIEAGIAIPESVRHVAVDFERDSLVSRLEEAGFTVTAPACFSWLGVTVYLTEEQVFETLRVLGHCAPGSTVVFDYAIARARLHFFQRLVYDSVAARVAAVGEPWRSGFDPATLGAELRALGFRVTEDFGNEALNARYFAGRRDGLKVGSLAHVMIAGL